MARCTRTRIVAASLALACAGMAAWLTCATIRRAAAADLTATVPGAQLRPGEALPLQMSLRNTGRGAVYMSLLVGGHVLDEKGERVVPPGPIPSPPSPPAENHVQIGEDTVYVEAVEEVEAGASITGTLADLLAIYHPLPKGSYAVVPAAWVAVYDASVVIRREDRDPKTWAQPEKAAQQFQVESNPIAIEVR